MPAKKQPQTTASAAPRTLRMKPYRVKDPSGKLHLAYALTSAGSIRAVQDALSEKWSAEPATGEDLYIAARDKLPIINAPASIAAAPEQTDALPWEE